MTQPDKFFPRQAANYSSLAVFAAKTQQDWEDDLVGTETVRWNRVNTGLRGGLDQDDPLPVVILRHLAQSLGIQAGLRTLADITSAIGEWVKTFVEDLGGLVSGVLGVGAKLVDNVQERIALMIERFLGFIGYGKIHSAGSLMGTGQVGEVNPELLLNGNFSSPMSMPEGAGWQWDGTVGHFGLGSAKMVANSTIQCMLSNSVDVWDTNEIECSVWVKWTGKVGTGPISMAMHVFDENDVLIDSPVLASAPSGTSSEWVKLEGAYSVTKSIGGKTPTSVALAFVVDERVSGGTIWWDEASLKKVNPLSHQLVGGFQDAMDSVTNKRQAKFDDFVDALQSYDTMTKGVVGDKFVPAVGRILETAVRGFQGLPPATDEYTYDDFLDAAAAQALASTGHGSVLNGNATILDAHGRRLTNVAADLEEIWTYLGEDDKAAAVAAAAAVSAGVSDDFERNTTGLGSNWSTQWGSGNGQIRTDGHNAALPFDWPGGASEWSSRWVGTDTSSTTDYQQVSVVISTSAQRFLGNCGHNDVLARVGGANDYIRFRVGGDGSWSVSKFVSGTEYIMQNTSGVLQRGLANAITRPGPGSIITLYAGEKSSSTVRKFKAMVNNTIVADFTEKTSVSGVPDSLYGSSYRGRGFGMRAEGIPFAAGWRDPGLVNYWASWDQI